MNPSLPQTPFYAKYNQSKSMDPDKQEDVGQAVSLVLPDLGGPDHPLHGGDTHHRPVQDQPHHLMLTDDQESLEV